MAENINDGGPDEERAQFKLRLPADLHDNVRLAAANNGRTINAELVHRLKNAREERTLRDWFAGQIANGMAAYSGTSGVSYGPGDIAGRSYEVADAMLAARSR